MRIVFAAALFAALWATNADARNQVWNQGTFVASAGGGSNSVTYPANVTTGILIGDAAACNVSVVLQDMPVASPVTLTNLQSGAFYPIAVKQIPTSGTTCAAIFVIGTPGN